MPPYSRRDARPTKNVDPPNMLTIFRHPLYQALEQGMVDGSASKPALRQDTGFWGLFNA